MKKNPQTKTGRQRLVYLGTDLDAAVDAHLQETGKQFASTTRQLWAGEIGQPELAESVKMGRPSSAAEPPPAKKSTTPPATPAKKPRKKPAK